MSPRNSSGRRQAGGILALLASRVVALVDAVAKWTLDQCNRLALPPWIHPSSLGG